jgi:2-hydroxymuconate-semialdehyde hydrolase
VVAVKERSFLHQGVQVHYLEGGAGLPIMMIHGSGPGASTLGNWRLVLEPLSQHFHIFAMDLIGFGKSGRKASPPYFDFHLWKSQCLALLERIPGDRVGVIGHSISGALALKLAAKSRKVVKVMTTGSMGAVFMPNESTVRTWTFPKNREELRRAAEGLIYDESLIDEAYLKNREAVLFSGDYESYFGEMFGGDKLRFIDDTILSSSELGAIKADVLMIHGREDVGFPPELTLMLSKSLPAASVVLLGKCSHSVAFEHPRKFVALARMHFEEGAAS